jgi:hypothetical protein
LEIGSDLTAHVGYARYASAPPVGEENINGHLADEHDDYADVGLQRKLGPVTLGADLYYRAVRNYLSEHETIGSAVLAPFEFKQARLSGLELSGTYADRSTSAWTNLAFSNARGRTVLAPQGLFDPSSLVMVSRHYMPLGSERPLLATGGLTRRVGKFSLTADIVLSSGAVSTFTSGAQDHRRRRPYAVFGLAGVYHARIGGQPADLRLDLTNLTNARYLLSDAANPDGGWTRWGRGRAITFGIEQSF